jgi:thioredoxin reductase (NADPH)
MSATPLISQDDARMFPRLSEEQIARIAPFANERSFADGELLWRQGDRDRPLFVVVEGQVEILSGEDHIVTVHGHGSFTGDVALVTGHPVVVNGRARGATRVLEVSSEKLRELVQTAPELSAIFLRAFMLRRGALVQQGAGNVLLVGSRHSAGTLELREFLTRNAQPFGYLDVDSDVDVGHVLERFSIGVDDVPVVICRGELVLKKPTVEELAACLKLDEIKGDAVRDLVVIGAGPGGLAAAVYGASEGLDVLVVEAGAPGGQAGGSSLIENYLGFPTGISGQALAERALVQAEKFGAELAVARTAVRLRCETRPLEVELGKETAVRARAVVIATGVKYRKLDVPDLARFEGVGVYYAATRVEAGYCRGEDVIVVGGGNSAGQAAVYLSGIGRHVHVLVRGAGLAETMSRYLVRRLEETPNITLRTGCEIVALEGGEKLERVTCRNRDGSRETLEVCHVFSMTGATPNTDWLQGCVALDGQGFVKTGQDIEANELESAKWPLARRPYLFETSIPGVFAVGDVRSGSVKRVAAAVGEGSVSVQLVHRALAD